MAGSSGGEQVLSARQSSGRRRRHETNRFCRPRRWPRAIRRRPCHRAIDPARSLCLCLCLCLASRCKLAQIGLSNIKSINCQPAERRPRETRPDRTRPAGGAPDQCGRITRRRRRRRSLASREPVGRRRRANKRGRPSPQIPHGRALTLSRDTSRRCATIFHGPAPVRR